MPKTPDSPINREAKPRSEKDPAGAQCFYNNQAYNDGDTTCIAPYLYVCQNGQWVYTGTGCGGQGANKAK
jgi:hypothetical protein